MFSAPVEALNAQIAKGRLGNLNPTPWAFMTGNCLGWVAYSFLRSDPYVLVGNGPGLILSIWLNMNACKLLYREYSQSVLRRSLPKLLEQSHRMSLSTSTTTMIPIGAKDGAGDKLDEEEPSSSPVQLLWEQTLDLIRLEKAPVAHEYMVLGIVTTWLLALSLVAFIPSSNNVKSNVVGFIVNANLLFFYGGPLSTMFLVIKERDSSSIHRRTMIMNTLNGAFWCAYGIGIFDYFMFIPNGIGALMGVVQFLMCFLFPPKKTDEQVPPTGPNSPAENRDPELHRVKIAQPDDSPSYHTRSSNGDVKELLSLETIDITART